jgi:hypothetical protein
MGIQQMLVASRAVTPPPSIRGLVGLWKLDETSGTVAADSSGNGHNAAYSGSGFTLGNSSLLPSAAGSSAGFSASSYVSLPSSVFNAIGRPLTIFGWGRTPNAIASQQIIASASNGFNFYLYSNNMYAGISGVSNNIIDGRSMAANTIYFWALTIDSSGNARIYVNGVSSAVATGAFSASSKFNDVITIGSYSGNFAGNYFQGTLQNIGICNVDLSTSEISSIYTSS